MDDLPVGVTEHAAQTVTINADRVPLKQLLDELAAETRVSISLPREMESESVTLSAHAVPLEDALRTLLDRKSVTFSYATLAADARDRRSLLAGVQISQEPNAMVGTASSSQLLGSKGNPAAGQTASPAQGPLKGTRSFDDLKQSIKEEKNPHTRLRLLETLRSRQGEGPIVPTLVIALGDQNKDIRQAALSLMMSTSEPIPWVSLAKMVSTGKNPETLVNILGLMSDSVSEGTWTKEERTAVASALTPGSLNQDSDIRDDVESLIAQLVSPPQ